MPNVLGAPARKLTEICHRSFPVNICQQGGAPPNGAEGAIWAKPWKWALPGRYLSWGCLLLRTQTIGICPSRENLCIENVKQELS